MARVVQRIRPDALSLDPDLLVESARRRSPVADGHFDLGMGPRYLEGLRRFTASLEEEAHLTSAGRYFARGQIVGSLCNRLEVASLLGRDPDVRTGSPAPAIVIVGLPRSGTTLLQHLLARDPDHRVLRHWEAARPAAPRVEHAAVRQAVARTLRFLDYLAPEARALHPVATDEPTECVTLMANSFASLELATNHQVPAYLEWCLSADMGFAYRELRLQLLVLEQRERRTRWLLKSPSHLFWLPELRAALPDLRVVQVHRDPVTAVGSFCSLSAVLSSVGSDRVDLRSLGARWAPAWAEGIRRAGAARTSWPADQWIDVEYEDLVADPLRQVERIYERFGLALPATTAQRMSLFLETKSRHGGATHRYTPSQFGLEPSTLADMFGPRR